MNWHRVIHTYLYVVYIFVYINDMTVSSLIHGTLLGNDSSNNKNWSAQSEKNALKYFLISNKFQFKCKEEKWKNKELTIISAVYWQLKPWSSQCFCVQWIIKKNMIHQQFIAEKTTQYIAIMTTMFIVYRVHETQIAPHMNCYMYSCS